MQKLKKKEKKKAANHKRSDLAEGKRSGPDSVEKFVPLFSLRFFLQRVMSVAPQIRDQHIFV